MWGPILPELTEALPGVENIERSLVNAWEEPRVRDAVNLTGRPKLLIAGITTPICLTFAARSAAADGYDVYALLDASGTWSDLLRLTAIDQMRQAGVTVTSGLAAFVEMLHDNASPIAGEFYAALDLAATRYILQITQGVKERATWAPGDLR
jgi:nicotinamidase-related amidase